MIRILKSQNINFVKWDNCVAADKEAKVYNYSDYLNVFSKHWKGLVVGDYEACIALPLYRRLALPWLFTPAGVQQVQLSQSGTLEDAKIDKVNEMIVRNFKLISLCTTSPIVLNQMFVNRTNYVLNLNRDYASIFSGYTKSCRRNLKKLELEQLQIITDISINTVINFYKSAYGLVSKLGNHVYNSFAQLYSKPSQRFTAKTYGVLDSLGNLIFAALILEDKKALYYVLGAPNDKGRKLRATYFFINQLILEHSNKDLKLDFEGSDLKSVSDFYTAFGPDVEHYRHYKKNNYNFPLNFIFRKFFKI